MSKSLLQSLRSKEVCSNRLLLKVVALLSNMPPLFVIVTIISNKMFFGMQFLVCWVS